MTILYSNDFEADSTGAAPSGWYGVFKVQSWNADATVSGSKAMLAYGEYDGYKSVYRGIAARTEADYRVKQKAQFNGGALLLQSLMHGDDIYSSVTVSNAYFCRVTAASASSVSLGLKRCIGTFFDETYQTTGSHSWSVSTGDVICQRLVIDGSNVKHYIWNESNESEPSTPTLEYTDTTERPAGYLYIVYNNGGGVVATGFDDVVISDVPAGGGAIDATADGVTLTGTSSLTAGSATGDSGNSASFVSDVLGNNTASIWANTSVVWEWRQGTGIGVEPTSVTYGSGTTSAVGVLTCTGLPTGAGELLIATPDYVNVAYQRGTAV